MFGSGFSVMDYVRATVLCIRFPFLYPRNRFTGNHYDCWRLVTYARENFGKAYRFEQGTYRMVCIDRYAAFKVNAARFINNYVVALFHFLPSYTELDAMPDGWRKAFGIRMCTDIRSSLLRNGGLKALLSYRIIQIKEQYGSLRWYDSMSNDEIFGIIARYEEESIRTCIDCGRKSEYMTFYRIYSCPYCGDCIRKVMERHGADSPLDVADRIEDYMVEAD